MSGDVTTADEMVDDLWKKICTDIMHINPAKTDWKHQPLLPLARVKKIMKKDEEILALSLAAEDPHTEHPKCMIAGEAPVLLSKACEYLIKELSIRGWRHTERNKRKTLQKQDIYAAVSESEVYDFLIDIIPRLPMLQSTTNGVTNQNPGSQPNQSQSMDFNTSQGNATNQRELNNFNALQSQQGQWNANSNAPDDSASINTTQGLSCNDTNQQMISNMNNINETSWPSNLLANLTQQQQYHFFLQQTLQQSFHQHQQQLQQLQQQHQLQQLQLQQEQHFQQQMQQHQQQAQQQQQQQGKQQQKHQLHQD